MMAHVAEHQELVSQMEALSDQDFRQDAEPVYELIVRDTQFVEVSSDSDLEDIKKALCHSLAQANTTAAATPFALLLAPIDEVQTVLLCR